MGGKELRDDKGQSSHFTFFCMSKMGDIGVVCYVLNDVNIYMYGGWKEA